MHPINSWSGSDRRTPSTTLGSTVAYRACTFIGRTSTVLRTTADIIDDNYGFFLSFSKLLQFVNRLPQDRHHVLGYIYRTDACFTYLSYYYRTREHDIGDGKNEKILGTMLY